MKNAVREGTAILHIDFSRIRSFGTGQSDAFEELCCQIFRRLYLSSLPSGSQFSRFRGSGGDGGVEAIWTLPNGEKWGLQAKYFYELESTQLRQMRESLVQAVENHPELTRYIFCLPFNPTGPTAGGRRGTSQTEKLERWVQQQQHELHERNISVAIEFWTETVLRDNLIEADPYGGMQRYWFDLELMTHHWLWERLEDAKTQAGRRYSPRLAVHVPAFDALEAFACSENWKARVDNLIQELGDKAGIWFRLKRSFSGGSDDVATLAQVSCNQLRSLESDLSFATDLESSFDIPGVMSKIDNLISTLRELEALLATELRDNYGENADSIMFRQFRAEYMADFPAEKLDITRELIQCLEKLNTWVKSSECCLPRSSRMLLRGPAGIGKTHAIIDHAIYRTERGQICLVFFGEDFTGAEPWEVIASKLGLSGNVNRDELWGMINAAAEASGKSAIIYIDALNESQERRRWKQSWLPTLRQQIARYSHLKLCVSCRDTYLDEVLEEGVDWPQVTHNGFLGREFEAVTRFFEFYELEPPATPLLQPEFRNPLFLHCVCQGIKGVGRTSLPLGSIGFTFVLRLLLEEKNKRISQVCDYDPRFNKTSEALRNLARMMASRSTRLLPIDVAKSVIDSVHPVVDYSRSLFYQLEKEGLIALVELPSQHLAAKEWYCRFTFERVADFLIAASMLEGIEAETIREQFTTGRLSFVTSSNEVVREFRGLLEAWSIILPEQYNVELVDVIESVDRYSILFPIMFSGFTWRSSQTFTDNTKRLILDGLSNTVSFESAMDALLGLAVIPDHPLNSIFLDGILRSETLTGRDSSWSVYLHFDYQKNMSGYRLLEWALKADLTTFSQTTVKLWAITLSWFCSASDRRVRDRATKGLVRLCVSKPGIMSDLLTAFLDVEDDYILERVSLACYSAVLMVKDDQCLTQLCDIVYTRVFLTQNIPLNVLIRDWLRLIMELGVNRGILNDSFNPEYFRPPFNSPWPIRFPDKQDIEHLLKQDAFKREMNLDSYGIGTDFARYMLQPKLLRRYDIESCGITKEQVYSWFIRTVAEELGYPGEGERCYKYDRYLVWTYGGGRSKPTWAERLGKKYYWILLQRLAGIFADHVPLRHDYWDSDDVETFVPRLQGIEFRDIDPTDLRDLSTSLGDHFNWWKPINYDFTSVSHISDTEWIGNADFPNPEEWVEVSDPDGQRWIHLSLSYSLKSEPPTGSRSHYPYRNMGTVMYAVTVPRDSLQLVRQAVNGAEYSPSFTEFQADNYRIFFGEYPTSLACEQSFETGELWVKCSIPGADEAQATTIALLRSGNFEYDCSTDSEVPSLQVPSPELIDFGRLAWDGQSAWVNDDGDIQIVNVRNELGSALLIRKTYLQEYLRCKSLVLVGIGIHEKMVITDGVNDLGIHELRFVWSFDGQNIEEVDSFNRV
jgi:hypothetical protein